MIETTTTTEPAHSAEQVTNEVAAMAKELADTKAELEAAKAELTAHSEAVQQPAASPHDSLTSVLSEKLSVDPLKADMEARAIAFMEIQRLRALLESSQPMTATRLVTGLLGI